MKGRFPASCSTIVSPVGMSPSRQPSCLLSSSDAGAGKARQASLPTFATSKHRLYVAPDGNDENAGTAEKPFRTLDRARQAVRQINENMTGDIVVTLRGGTYPIDRTIIFDGADSGPADTT